MHESCPDTPIEAFPERGPPAAAEERPSRLRRLAGDLVLGLPRSRATRRAQRKLLEAEAKYRTLVEQLPLVTYIDALTPTASAIYASPQVTSLLGYSVPEWLDDPEFFAKILHPEDRRRVLERVEHCNTTAEPFRAEYRLIARDGRTVWVQDESLVLCDDDGRPLFTQGYLLDITDRKESEQRLAAEHGVARVLSESATVGEALPRILQVVSEAFCWELGQLLLLDRKLDVLRCAATYRSPIAEATAPESLAGKSSYAKGDGLPGRVWAQREAIWVAARGGSTLEAYAVPILLGAEFLGVIQFGSRGLREPDESLGRTLSVIAGQVAQFIERTRSEEERRWAEEKIWHQALHDGLTGLPNRTLFHDAVGEALERVHRNGGSLALVVMDLDRFKEVNDTLGHHAGDALLRELGDRLRSSVRASDTVARLGGDEFGFLLNAVTASEAVELVERIQRALADPFPLRHLPLQVESSIGIALYPEHGETVDVLLQRADVAMYVAKRSGASFEFYEADKDDYTLSRLTMVGDLRRALEHGELELHFQPLVRLESGAVTGAETLLRWQHPTRGVVPPDEFVPIAERTALMGPLTSYVIDGALRQCQQWRRLGNDLTVAVNVSMQNLLDSDFPSEVEALLEKYRVPASRLVLEITEHSVVADRFRAEAVLERLSRMGLRIAIDDFGTGYSSLAYLRRLPLQEIKIDRSFVHALTTDRDDAVIVRSTIDLARNLGLEVVAEGVDTREILTALVELGCDSVQGYYVSPPLPATEFTAWLRDRGSAWLAVRGHVA